MAVQYFGSTDISDGESPIGSYSAPGWVRNKGYVTGFTCPGSGSMTIKELQAYCRVSSGSGNMRIAVYSASHNLVAESGKNALSTSAGWQGPTNLSLGPLTGGVQYDLAMAGDAYAFGCWCSVSDYGVSTYGDDDFLDGFPSSLADGPDWDSVLAIRCGVEATAATTYFLPHIMKHHFIPKLPGGV